MITISLLAVFFGVVYDTVIAGLRVTNASDEREGLRQQLANALDRLTREASLASSVNQATSSLFQFIADVDGDGNNDTVTYQVQGTDLQRVGTSTVTLVKGLTTLTPFSYFKSGGSAWVAADGVSAIRIAQATLTATSDQETISLASAVRLRNR